ncbi:hypothetical protein SAMN05421739_102161 [Pontibacter chinhatensis]|uniref:Uncharacterized protein n=1 Tax=Pontibacter chinhatensis TaxID=1436961 RepID=A0A1I2QUT0_9BACT|nr:hypothetical protein SAMN05421739_102161 [Pontibacter chinhatensis]
MNYQCMQKQPLTVVLLYEEEAISLADILLAYGSGSTNSIVFYKLYNC